MLINTLLTRYKSLFYAKKHFPIHLIALLLTGCITDFIPEVKGTRDILVVEGTITNGTSIFRLSRSVSITDTLKGDHMITDAWLGVERDDGHIIPATNLGHGSYSVATGELDPQASYRLRFTIGDKPYHSTFLSPVETAAIDSVTYRKKGLGKPLEILVSTQGEKKGSPYYRWNYWETWEIKAPIFAKHGYIDGKLTQFSMLTSLNTYYCWGRDSSKVMLLETTDKLSENRVDRKKLFEIPCDDERISILYHLRVSQTQLHEEAYDYFRAMQEAIERTGDLFSLVMSGGENGKVAITGTLRNADIASRIVKKRSEYRQETIENILKLADQEKATGLSEGKTVVDGVGQYLPTVSGAFEGEKAPFNPEIHHLSVSFTMGKELREQLAAARVETRTASSGIVINSVRDALTGETDGAIASGSNLVISGVNIKIAGDDPSNGVFLTPTAGGEPIAMRAITHNNPSELTVLLPTLEEGEYTLSVTTQFSQSHTLKEPRTYVYPVTLTVGTDEGGGTPGGV